jgi:hypothetical protein
MLQNEEDLLEWEFSYAPPTTNLKVTAAKNTLKQLLDCISSTMTNSKIDLSCVDMCQSKILAL